MFLCIFKRWHPDRVTDPAKKEEAQAKFQEISHAFEVLSDPEKKKIYDQVSLEEIITNFITYPYSIKVGEEGLNGGFAGASDGASAGPGGSFHFSGMPGGMNGTSFHFTNADEIFRNFFGTNDPFAAEGAESGGFPFAAGGFPGRGFGRAGGFPQSQPSQKAPPVNHTLNVTLEDLYVGITKRVRITKKLLDSSGVSTQVSSEKEIVVKKGWKDGTKITFEREGDEAPGVIPADIIFTIQTKPHDRFQRDGDDLLYTCKISLLDALSGNRQTVKSLDGRDISIDTRNCTSGVVKIIPGEGMINAKVG